MKRKRSGSGLKLLVLVLLLAFLFLGAMVLLRFWEKGAEPAQGDSTVESGAPSDGEDRELTFYDGEWYARREDLETILVMGLDKYAETSSESYNNDQQADFLLVLVLDREGESYTVLQLNRDTMTEIPILGVTGAEAGSFRGQLALAHTYGSGGNDSCRNTVTAVENLLYGTEIDHYLSMTMDGVALLNDLVGGVTVEVLDDFTGIDDTLVKGETVTLQGEQALTYVRARHGLDDSSNLHRMERQRQYPSQLQQQLTSRAAEDSQFIMSALLDVNEYLYSDCTVQKLSDLANQIGGYSMGEILTPEGKAVQGEEYMEFNVDEEALQALLIQVFYELA